MKMPEKHDSVGRHSRGKGIAHRATRLRLYRGGRYAMWRCVYKTGIDATMCAIIA